MMPCEKPVFIFSSSWRSGSTLLQRYITASGEVLVWGETVDALGSLRDAMACWEQTTAESSRSFTHGTGGDGEQAFRKIIATTKSDHAQKWGY